MKTITKFIFGFPMLALACGSIAFAQVPIPPMDPADSAAKALALGEPGGDPVDQMVEFKSGSRWHLTVNAVNRFGLVITGASFQKSPNEPFIYVLFDGRLGEIFVPYHSKGGPRYGDISGSANGVPDRIGPYNPLTLKEEDFRPRQIIGGRLMSRKICKEVRQYLAWMTDARVRYGQEVVYFSVLNAANYDYIMEWTFRDDGAILVRGGSTGPKLGGGDDTRGHMHNFTWRLDVDLDGAGGDSASLTSHYEDLTASPGPGVTTATDEKDLISVEGSEEWNPQKFNTLQIGDRTLKNRPNGRATAYELVPMRSGTARHTEPFLKKDFWVTRYDREQSFFAINLPTYIRNQQSTVNQDLVIWYTGSEHHENKSRDEDDNTVPVLWTGFDLVPNNLFNGTPFFRNP
jgi:Cu2+-containing amine oxidase